MKVVIERNKTTGKWRYLDKVTMEYSSKEWDTRDKAWSMSCQYYDLMYRK